MEIVDGLDLTRLLAGSAVAAAMVSAFAIFYGAPSSSRGGDAVRAVVARSLCAIPLVGVGWVLLGAALVLGPSHSGHLGGGWAASGWDGSPPRGMGVSFAVGGFRMMVAAALPAIVSDFLARNKLKLSATIAFAVLWSVLVYAPLAHWVWGGGWLSRLGAVDFGGASVIYLSSGVSGLTLLFALERHPFEESEAPSAGPILSASGWWRRNDRWPSGSTRDAAPSLAGAGMLWFCWLISNAAPDPAHPKAVAVALVATQLGGAGGAMGWLIAEWRDRGKTSARGVAWGLVSGLIAITAAAGYVSSSAAIAIGFVAGAASYGSDFGVLGGFLAALLAIAADAGHVAPATAVVIALVVGAICYGSVLLKDLLAGPSEPRGRRAVAIQVVSGLLGMLLTGIFAQNNSHDPASGGALFGHPRLFFVQLLAAVVSGTYACALSLLILRSLDALVGLRPKDSAGSTIGQPLEPLGLDEEDVARGAAKVESRG